MSDYWYDHVHLMSSDPVKTAEFYEEMFGARRVSAGEAGVGRVRVELNLNGSRILIVNPRVPPEKEAASRVGEYGLEHFGIRTDDLATAVAELKAKGVNFRGEILDVRPGVRVAFMWAPENVLIELLESKE